VGAWSEVPISARPNGISTGKPSSSAARVTRSWSALLGPLHCRHLARPRRRLDDADNIVLAYVSEGDAEDGSDEWIEGRRYLGLGALSA